MLIWRGGTIDDDEPPWQCMTTTPARLISRTSTSGGNDDILGQNFCAWRGGGECNEIWKWRHKRGGIKQDKDLDKTLESATVRAARHRFLPPPPMTGRSLRLGLHDGSGEGFERRRPLTMRQKGDMTTAAAGAQVPAPRNKATWRHHLTALFWKWLDPCCWQTWQRREGWWHKLK